jgi:hypothetical protein
MYDQNFFQTINMCFKKPEFDADFKTAKSPDANASERKVKEVRFNVYNSGQKSSACKLI